MRRERTPILEPFNKGKGAAVRTGFSKTTGDIVEGSPLIAINTNPPFSEYHFIDADPRRAEQLRCLVGDRHDVFIESADCNDLLIQRVFPRAKFSDFTAELCACLTRTISI